MLSKPHLSISDGLRCLAFQQSATSSWQRSSAHDLHLLWSLSEHILQNWCLSLLQSYNVTASSWHILVIAEVDYFMRFVVASRWSWRGVLDVVQHCSAISSSNDSWMGVSTSSYGDINVTASKAACWKLPILKYFAPTRVVAICWEMKFDAWGKWNSCLNLSDIICCRICVSVPFQTPTSSIKKSAYHGQWEAKQRTQHILPSKTV